VVDRFSEPVLGTITRSAKHFGSGATACGRTLSERLGGLDLYVDEPPVNAPFSNGHLCASQ